LFAFKIAGLEHTIGFSVGRLLLLGDLSSPNILKKESLKMI